MTTRRSARLRLAEEGQAMTAGDVPTTSPSPANAPAAMPKAKKAKPTTGQAKETKTQTDAHASHGKDLFSLLPPELMSMVLGHIGTPLAVSVLARTSRYFYNLMMPRLYHRIEVSAGYHSHIAKFIRTIEPLLSISQKKALKKVGKYRGQKERYANTLDANAVPLNVRFVRQLVVGHINPGRKHIDICIRYLEELLKNLTHLELLSNGILTRSMAESIASMHNLQALSYTNQDSECETADSLSQIRNLKHLKFRRLLSYTYVRGDILRSLLQNSASTLRSLSFSGGFLDDLCFKKTDDQGKPGDQWIEMASLHTLRIQDFTSANTTPNFLRKSINLLQLRELEVGRFTSRSDKALPLYSQLISAFGEAPDGAPPALRKLTLHLGDLGAEAFLPMRLLYSLDTLTSLVIFDFHSTLNGPDPAISDMLQRAILMQKNLRCLKFVCNGLRSDGPLPYMPAKVVRRFVKGLPHLREFEFALAMDDIVPISRALLLGANLESVNVLTLQVYPTPTPEHADVVGTIVREFLAHSSGMDAKKRPEERGPFVWEHEFRLRRVVVNWNGVFDLGSFAGKRGKGSRERRAQRTHEFTQEGQYRVLCREAARSVYSLPDPEAVWLDQVQKDLD